jgi:hypothetical protein
MPIKPENRHRYLPRKDWLSIREFVLTRAEYRCEFCGVENKTVRNNSRIFLAVAHLDQCPENNHLTNLAALCQKCHVNHDKPFQVFHSKITRAKRLFSMNFDIFGFDFDSIEAEFLSKNKAAF